MKKEIKEIIKKYKLEQTSEEKDGKFLSICYDYKIFLKNLNTTWYLKFENKTRKCNFYTVYTRFYNCEVLQEINKIIACNTYSGKCNQFIYDFQSIDNFINNVLFLENNFRKAA